MNIVFLTLGYPKNPKDKNIYTDLMYSLVKQGNTVTVYRQNECHKGVTSEYVNGVKIVSIYTGEVTKVSFIKKGINLILLKYRFLKIILNNKHSDIDLLLYSTPPITFAGIIKKLKRVTYCKTLLLLKDIFPQNAVDLNLFSKKSITYLYFRHLEKKLYKYSDYIGCMSPANKNYLLSHNSKIDERKVFISPNSIIPTDCIIYKNSDNTLKLIYGGNIGKPQGIDFLLNCIDIIEKKKSVKFTVIGNGTEFNRIKEYLKLNSINNTSLFTQMPIEEYHKLLKEQDMGMVFLDYRFSIPNFPSRILDYLDFNLPIFACTDKNSDVNTEICDAGAGIWCLSNDIRMFEEKLDYIIENRKMLLLMSEKSKKILVEKYNSDNEARKIIEKLMGEI